MSRQVAALISMWRQRCLIRTPPMLPYLPGTALDGARTCCSMQTADRTSRLLQLECACSCRVALHFVEAVGGICKSVLYKTSRGACLGREFAVLLNRVRLGATMMISQR